MAVNYQPKQRRGVVLLLALLVMASITATTVTVSVIITNTLDQSRSLDNFIVASLASDTGVERGLGVLKIGRTYHSLTGTVAAMTLPGTRALSNGAAFSLVGSDSEEPVTSVSLAAGQTLTLDVMRKCNNLTCATPTPPPSFLQVTGDCAGTCASLIDVSWVVVDGAGNSTWSGRRFFEQESYDLDFSTAPVCLNLKENLRTEDSDAPAPFQGNNEIGYRVRVRAVDGPVSTVAVNAFSDPICGTQEPIYSRVHIESVGESGGTSPAQSTKQAEAFWQQPSSPVLNYIIFTEESIIP